MSDIQDTTIMLLAGGRGTRLQPVLGDTPKVLAAVHGRPFITFLLDKIAAAGFGSAVLCCAHGAETLRRILGTEYRDLQLTYSVEEDPLGTAGAARQALNLTGTGNVLIMNGDTCVNLDLRDYLDWHEKAGIRVSLVVTEVSDCRRFGLVELDKSGRVTAFHEKPTAPVAGYVNTGVYLFARELLERIPPQEVVSLEKEFLPTLIGEDLRAYRCPGPFLDIGTPESYARAPQFLSTISADIGEART